MKTKTPVFQIFKGKADELKQATDPTPEDKDFQNEVQNKGGEIVLGKDSTVDDSLIPRVVISKEAIDVMIKERMQREQEEREQEERRKLEAIERLAKERYEQEQINKAVEQRLNMLRLENSPLHTVSTNATEQTDATEQPNALERLKNISKHPNAATAINRAIESGYIINNGSTLKWVKSKADLAYFAEKLCCPNKTDPYPTTELGYIFNKTRLDSAKTQNYNRKKGFPAYIDMLFNAH